MDDGALNDLLDQARDAMTATRHDLHAHPELSFEERRTTDVIRERLTALGWTLQSCPTKTGAVAHLAGRGGRHVLLRADIDALPVAEETDLPFASLVPGAMHACGHDVHTAGLLGAAEVLATLAGRGELVGSYTAVFQPAEEGLGGARAMVNGGLFDQMSPDAAIGVHVTSIAPVGLVASRPGVLMSEANAFRVELTGPGGHGALAEEAGNVVLAAAALAPRLGEIVAGLAFEGVACVCSAGTITAGTAPNVIPRRATVTGTVRTFTDEQRESALARLRDLVASVADRFAVTGVLSLSESAPVVVNDEAATHAVLDALEQDPALEVIRALPPTTTSDDVSEFLRRVPGCYLFVGGAPPGGAGMHHAPDFVIDDDALVAVARTLVTGARALAQAG